MDPDTTSAPLRRQYNDIAARLKQVLSGPQRDKVKSDIIGLFKMVDQTITELSTLKEDIRTLVDQYKELAQNESADQAPQFTGAVPVMHDHLNASTYIEKGWSLTSLGDYNGAIQALSKALELAPDDAQAQSQLGWAQMLQGDYDVALGSFQQVLMKEPANSLARINVGYICLKKRIFGEAIEHLSKAIRLDNDKKATLYAHYYLGLVYFEREMYEDAENFFQKTLVLGPNLIEAYYEMGRAQWYAEDYDTARETWAQGYKANKLTTWGKRCKEALERVERGEEPLP